MKKQGSNSNTIKADNNSLVLSFIRKKAMSRAEIAKLTGLSKSTVTAITKEMLEQGQLIEIGTENTSNGRHPILLDIVKNYRYAIGIEITRSEVSVCLANLKLENIGFRKRLVMEFKSAEQILDWAYSTAIEIMNDNSISMSHCIGISVVTLGPLDYVHGIITNPPNFPLFQNFNVKSHLRKKCNLPVFLNKVSVPMAIFEYQKRNTALKNFIFVNVDSGVGSAIIHNGNIYRGSHGHSGEIGHMTVDIKGEKCACGNVGCLECYLTQKAILKSSDFRSYKQLVDSAYEGDPKALKVIEETAFYFASGLIGTINLLDLEAVVLYGELNYRCELLISKIQEIIDDRCIITKSHPVLVMPSLISKEDNISFTASIAVEKYYQS